MKEDRAVTASDIASSNLILFGDPWSNRVIAKIIARLPHQMDKVRDHPGWPDGRCGHSRARDDLPKSAEPERYVVINSGHTFSDSDWRGTNANLYPHIGDYALMRLEDGETVHSGFFDEHWR